MEPEEKYEILEKFIKSRAWQYDDEILDAFAHKVATPSDKKEMLHPNSPNVNLAYISTRELLNECYRRRAIEKFVTSIEAPIEAFEDQEHNSYLMRHIDEKLWYNVVNSNKFYSEALLHSKSALSSGFTRTLTGEIYICKHPSKVKK